MKDIDEMLLKNPNSVAIVERWLEEAKHGSV
jgi:hypothetical protein